MMKFISGMANHFRGSLIALYIFRTALFVTQYLLYHPKKFRRERVEKILVVRLTHLGDLLVSLPTIHSLRLSFPEAKISLVVGVWNKDLAEEFKELFDEILFYNVTKYCRRPEQKQKLSERLRILKILNRQGFDLCVDFDGSVGFLFFYLLRSTRFLASIEAIRFWQNMEQLGIAKNKFPYNIFKNHEIDNLASVLELLKLDNFTKEFVLTSRFETEASVDKLFSDNSILRSRLIVGIHPSTSLERKMWSVEKFAELADYLTEKYDCAILIFGAKQDEQLVSSIQALMKSKATKCTNFSIAQFIAAVKRCDLFICLDSFSQHVAFMQSIPMIVIFTHEYIARCAPYGDGARYSILVRDECAHDISTNDVIGKIPPRFLEVVRQKFGISAQ